MIPQVSQTGVAEVNNTKLSYDCAGSGQALTLIHGMLLDRRSWDDQFTVFAQQYRVLRYDMRGWGDSAQEEADKLFSPREDLLRLLEYLQIEKTVLMGVSGGGGIALDFTLEHPEKVDALILVSSGASGYPFKMTEETQTFIDQYYGALQKKDIDGAAEATVRYWTDGPRRKPEQVDPSARARVTEMSVRHLREHGDMMAHQEHMIPLEPLAFHRLTTVKVPTLIVVGAEDVPAMLLVAEMLEREIAQAKKVVLSDVAHHPHMEKPEVFNRIVLEFLNSLPL